jgi:hypothetical protein
MATRVTTHKDNPVCIDPIDKDLVHDGKRNCFVAAENSESNGSGIGVAWVFFCSQLRFPCSYISNDPCEHKFGCATLKEIPFPRKLDEIYERPEKTVKQTVR